MRASRQGGRMEEILSSQKVKQERDNPLFCLWNVCEKEVLELMVGAFAAISVHEGSNFAQKMQKRKVRRTGRWMILSLQLVTHP